MSGCSNLAGAAHQQHSCTAELISLTGNDGPLIFCLKIALAADPPAASLGTQLHLAFTDLKAAQVKTISFFTFLLRVTPGLLQPHKVNPISARFGDIKGSDGERDVGDTGLTLLV